MVKEIEDATRSPWFQILGGISSAIAIPIILFLGKMLIDLQTEVKVLESTINYQLHDVYHGDDAKRDLAIRDLRIDLLQNRLGDLEHEVRKAQTDPQPQNQPRR